MRQRGSILVLALAVLAGLIAILAGLAATHHLFVTAEANRLEAARARLAAMNGIERALEVLYVAEQTGGTGTASATTGPGVKTLQDDWAIFGQQANESFVTGNSSFRVQIVDLSGRMNINTATEEQLQRLPLTTEQIESLLDFREPGQQPRPEGAKDAYYNELTEGYNAKLRPLDTFDELLQVKGWTPSMLYEVQTDVVNTSAVQGGNIEDQLPLSEMATVYSYAPETNPAGEAKINVNGGNAQQRIQRMVQSGLPQPIAQQIGNQNWPTLAQILQQVPMSAEQQAVVLDNLTTSAAPRVAGKINLNTASEAVLNTVPGITPDIAQAIVQRQQQGFATLGEVIQIPGMADDALQGVDFFTVGSQTFLIRVVGRSGSSAVALEAVVDIQEGRPKIMQIQEPPYSDYYDRWIWQPESSSETVLVEAE